MRKKGMPQGVGQPDPMGVVGSLESTRMTSNIESAAGEMEQMPEGDGMQHGQHPAKHQPKILRYI